MKKTIIGYFILILSILFICLQFITKLDIFKQPTIGKIVIYLSVLLGFILIISKKENAFISWASYMFLLAVVIMAPFVNEIFLIMPSPIIFLIEIIGIVLLFIGLTKKL